MDTSSTPIKSEAQAKIEGNPLASSSHPAEQFPKTSLNNDQGFSILEGLALVVVESTESSSRLKQEAAPSSENHSEPSTPPSNTNNKKRKSKGSSSCRKKKAKENPGPVVLSDEAKQVLCSPDVLYEIFSYLVFSDVVHRIILVNKTWKSIVANLNKLWEDYILFQWPHVKLTMDMRRTSSLETFKNYYTNNCYECFKTLKKASSFSTLRSRTGCVIKVCDDCAFSGPYSERKLYTKTRMYELLKLNDKDIANLPYKEGYSSAYRKTTTNLCLKNCYHKALSKYFTKGGIEANNERLKAIAEKRRQNLENAKKERKAELIKALEEEGLELRADSRLCEAYINGTCHQSLEQVVDTMKEMRFYHETISSYVQSEFEAMNNWFDNEDMDDRWLRREMRSVNRAEIAYPAALKSWVHDMKEKGETLETLLETAPSTLHADIQKAYSKK